MIEYLTGTLFKKSVGHIVILAGGVGYGVSIPLSTFEALPAQGEEAALWIYHQMAEGDSSLYGFAQPEGREIFSILLTVSGVGPKLAVKMLSSLTIEAFTGAISSGDVGALTGVPGIGKKTAERLILELKDKLVRHANAADRNALDQFLRDADAVVHCAGAVRGSSQQQFDRTNVAGTQCLLQAMLSQEKPARLVLLSSLAAREPGLSWYASSKSHSEQLLRDVGSALNWIIVRLAPIRK